MSKNLKLTLGCIGCLAIGGTLYPVLKSSLISPNALKGLQGGSFNVNKGANWNDYKLRIEGKKYSSQLDLKGKSNSFQDLQLDVEKEDLLTLENLSDQDRSSFISNIFSEILIETKAKDLDSRMNSKYEELTRKHLEIGGSNRTEMLKTFQKAETSIRSWLKTKPKTGRQAPKKSLSKEERVSLQKFYEFWHDLQGAGSNFSTELSTVSGESGKDPSQQPKSPIPRLKDLQQSLRVINWDKSKLRVQPMPSTKFLKANAWGEWNKNPFKPFYNNEREFQQHLSGMNSSSLKITRLEQEISRESSMWGGMGRAKESFAAQKKQVQELKANQSSEIEYHIGSKLLDFMNRR